LSEVAMTNAILLGGLRLRRGLSLVSALPTGPFRLSPTRSPSLLLPKLVVDRSITGIRAGFPGGLPGRFPRRHVGRIVPHSPFVVSEFLHRILVSEDESFADLAVRQIQIPRMNLSHLNGFRLGLHRLDRGLADR